MGLRGDERAQSVQVGAVILFGFLIVGLATYQATVVPSQNEQVEFDQSNAVREDMTELRNALQTAGTTGESDPVEIQLGARFQPRTLFVNPPPAAGTVRTQQLDTRNATLTFGGDTEFVSSETGQAADYWIDGSNAPQNFSTKLLVYEGDYREYDAAPDNVSIQLGHVVASYPSRRTVNVTDAPNLVQNDRLTLVLVKGNLSRGGVDATTVDPSSISQISRREEVNGTVTATVPTTLSVGAVRGVLNATNESSPIDITVTAGPTSDTVNVTLDTTDTEATLKLGVAAVAVGTGSEETRPGYIDVEAVRNASTGEVGEVVVEVRDQFGNPVSGRLVNATSADGVLADDEVRTGPDGRATFEFASDTAGDFQIDVSFRDVTRAGFADDNPEDAVVPVSITSPTGGGAGNGTGVGTVNPPGSVQLEQSFRDNPDEAVFVLNNTGGSDRMISRARIAFYFNEQGGNNPTEAVFVSSDNQPTMDVGGGFVSVNGTTIPEGGEVPICYRFSGGSDDNVGGDFFVTVIEFENGTTRQYFITPEGQGPSCVAGGTGGDGGDTFPPSGASNAVAFDDADGDEQYDDGETVYNESELDGLTGSNIDLVVAVEVTDQTVDVNVNSTVIKADIRNIGGNRPITINADSRVEVRSGVRLETGNRNADIRLLTNAIGTGVVEVNGATLDSAGAVTLSSGNTGAVRGTDATINTANSNPVEINGGSVTLVDASISSPGDADDSIVVTATGSIDLRQSLLDADQESISLTSNGSMDLRSAQFITSDDIPADLTDSNDLLVEDLIIEEPDGSTVTLKYRPSGVTVVGSPQKGTVEQA